MSGADDAPGRAGTGDPLAPLAELDRRRFLQLAGAAAAAGLLPSGCGGVPDGLAPPPDLALRVLSPRGYAVMRAATRAVVGPPGAALVERGALDPGAAADRFLAEAAPRLGGILEQALLVLEFGVWPLLGKLRPFTALDDAGREAVLRECMRSRLALKRQLFAGVRAAALVAFWGEPASYALARVPGAPGVSPVSIEDAMRYRPEL